MSRVRAIAVDVDGTLLDPSHRVTPAAARAIQRLRVDGVLVVVTTSRYPPAVEPILREVGLLGEPVVTCQGAVWGAHAPDGRFRSRAAHLIPIGAAVGLTAVARSLRLGTSWFYPEDWLVEPGDSMVAQEEAITGARARRVAALGPQCPPPAKIVLMAPPDRIPALARARAAAPGGVAAATSRPDYLEVVAHGVSKWTALTELFAEYGIPLGEVAAIGDGENDLEMVSRAAVGIAMGHAPAALRDRAAWVAPDNGHEGFAAAADWLLTG